MPTDKRSGDDRREGYCSSCIRDDYLAAKGGNLVRSIIVYGLLTVAMGGGLYSSVRSDIATEINAAQNTQIALNTASVKALKLLIDQNRLGLDRISQQQHDQTSKILAAIEGIGR